jgi:hypothetical protein
VATKVPLVIRIDSELRERIIKAYPGNTITESVTTALNASLSGEGEIQFFISWNSRLLFHCGVSTLRKKGSYRLQKLREEIESLKENIDTIANRYDF